MMAIHKEHDLHRRRARRNMMVGLVLGGFVVLVFGITMVKIKGGDKMEAFDHQPRYSLERPSN
jgi:hypothetical protein